MGEVQDADLNLRHALEIMPDDSRALHYEARAESAEGLLTSAMSDLQRVLTRFPDSLDVHRELGFIHYLRQEYTQAQEQYEAVQRIDPDDVSAHYYLAVIYKREGNEEAAAAQAALYADKKDDPASITAKQQFLRDHAEISGNNIPWHLHRLEAQKPAH
jgi:tetratricopeptide (TPR) repeat protein